MTSAFRSSELSLQRRSTRISQAVPLIVSGQDKIGQWFQERTATVVLNAHGCRFRSRYNSPVGSWVTLMPETVGAAQRIRARVKWLQFPRNPTELFQVGVELERPGNIWGVGSPPPDWAALPETPGNGSQGRAAAAVVPVREKKPAQASGTPTEISQERAVRAGDSRQAAGEKEAGSAPGLEPGKARAAAERLVALLEEKAQQVAQQAVESVVTEQANEAVRRAMKNVEESSVARLHRLEERWAQQLDEKASGIQELVAGLKRELAQFRQDSQARLETQSTRAEEALARLEKLLPGAQHAVAEAQKFFDHRTRELRDHVNSRLGTAVEQAVAVLGQQATQICDRQLTRLTERSQAAMSEAGVQCEARAAEARSQLDTAATATLKEFSRRMGVEIDLGLADMRQKLETALGSLAATHQAAIDERQRGWKEGLVGLTEQATESFRKQLESIANSWLMNVISAVNQQTRAVLDSLARQAESKEQ